MEFDPDVHFSWFGLTVPFLGKFGPNDLNCLLKMKFGTEINQNKLNLMAMLIYPAFDRNACFGL